MRLHPEACEYYRLNITTEPPIESSAWEMSIDGGETWLSSVALDDDAGWLVKGPQYDGASEAIAITRQVVPLIRAIDVPETVVRSVPRIELKS